jgi:hypothetical protein
MPQARAVLSVIVSLFLAFFSQAQQITPLSSPNSTSNPQAIQIALQSLAAMKYVPGPLSLRATGQIHSPDQEDGTFEVVATGPRTYRTTTSRASKDYVYLMNDGIGSVTTKGKVHHVGGAEVMAARCPFFPFYSFIGELHRPDVVVQTVKTGSINGDPTYVLATTVTDMSNPSLPIQSVSEMEVDAKSFLPLKLRMQQVHSENIEIVSHLEYSFDDYRQEGALLLPHSITLTVDGAVAYLVTLNNFQFNVTADLTVTF